MSKDKTKIYKIELLLAVILFACTLLQLTINKYFTATLLIGITIIISLLLKRDPILKHEKNKIEITMVVFGILYIALFYMLGIYTGFYKQTDYFGVKTLVRYIIPIAIIIISSEIIRNKLLLDDSTKSKVLTVIIGTLIDISIYLDLYGMSTLDGFLALVGFVSFSALANNILYTYISAQYGRKPIIYYKLITILYIYFIPIAPKLYIYFRTFVRMLYPLLIYSYIDKYYSHERKVERPKERKSQIISMTISCTIMAIIIGLISCKFLYGVLVIGSESMTGSINKGDVVFFKNRKEDIKEGDVIIFKKDDIKVVHRVTKIRNINKQFRYYTKGDANPLPDEGYITQDALLGKALFKIRYIGRPTLWLRDMFDKEG